MAAQPACQARVGSGTLTRPLRTAVVGERLTLDRYLEPAVHHALEVEWHLLPLHHGGDPRIGHDLRVHAVAVLARLVEDPRKNDGLSWLRTDPLGVGQPHRDLQVVADALAILERAVLLPHLRRLPRHG